MAATVWGRQFPEAPLLIGQCHDHSAVAVHGTMVAELEANGFVLVFGRSVGAAVNCLEARPAVSAKAYG